MTLFTNTFTDRGEGQGNGLQTRKMSQNAHEDVKTIVAMVPYHALHEEFEVMDELAARRS